MQRAKILAYFAMLVKIELEMVTKQSLYGNSFLLPLADCNLLRVVFLSV
jgi:hypothetical protein